MNAGTVGKLQGPHFSTTIGGVFLHRFRGPNG